MMITIIDDDISTIKILKLNLDKNYQTVSYTKPLLALDDLLNFRIKPDIIICDYLMFDIDGIELINSLKENNINSIIFLLTSVKSDQLIEYCLLNNIYYFNKTEIKYKEMVDLINIMKVSEECQL